MSHLSPLLSHMSPLRSGLSPGLRSSSDSAAGVLSGQPADQKCECGGEAPSGVVRQTGSDITYTSVM